MKSMSKKISALILTLVMCVSLAACNGSSSSSQASSTGSKTESTASETDPYAEHMSISIALWGIGDTITDPNKDATLKAIYDKFNIEIEPFPVTWGDYGEKIKLWAASNKLPDMTAYEAGFTTMFDDWTTQGIVRALPSDLSKYPNVASQVYSDYGFKVNKNYDENKDATFYAVPRPQALDNTEFVVSNGIAVRKDWMTAVGVTEVPDTIDGLIDLLKKFQTEDPDGNGINDTIGLTGYTYSWMSALFQRECPEAVNDFRWMYAEDGSLIPAYIQRKSLTASAWMSEDFLKAMKDMKKVYDAGVMDPDYIILKGEEGRDKFITGKAGAYAHAGPGLGAVANLQSRFVNTYPDKNIEDLITFLPLLASDEGKIEYVTDQLCWSETYLSSSVSDAKAERCMALLDFILSDEGYDLLQLGFEGEDYTKDSSGNITIIEQKDASGEVLTHVKKYPSASLMGLAFWSGFRSLSSPTYSQSMKTLRQNYIDEQLARGAEIVDRPDVAGLVITETTEYNTIDFAQFCNKLMTASDLESAWKALVQENLDAGYDQVIAEMNKLWQDSGRASK